MSKKEKKPPETTQDAPTSLKEQAEWILSELERTGETLRSDIGKTVDSFKDNLSTVTKSLTDSSTDQVKGILQDVENLGQQVLEDIGGSLESIKSKVAGTSGPPEKSDSKKKMATGKVDKKKK